MIETQNISSRLSKSSIDSALENNFYVEDYSKSAPFDKFRRKSSTLERVSIFVFDISRKISGCEVFLYQHTYH